MNEATHKALPWLASLAWFAAFSAGRAAGNLYPFLASTALLLIALFVRDPALRARLRGKPIDVVIGLAAGGASLVATYGLFPYAKDAWSPLEAEVRGLYVLAATTPLTLTAVVIVATAEEVIWRGALLESVSARFGFFSVVVAAIPYAVAQLGAGSWPLAGTAFLFGLWWGALAWWRGNLVAPLLAHLCWTPIVLGARPLVEMP